MATPALMSKSEETEAVYRALMDVLEGFGKIQVQEKKTSLHITAGRAAFLGVHPRKGGLRLNIVLARPLEGPRIAKSEKVSARRFHNEVDLKAPSELDSELQAWLREAYELLAASPSDTS